MASEREELASDLIDVVVDSLVADLLDVIEGLGDSIDANQLKSVADGFKENAASQGVLANCVERLGAFKQGESKIKNRVNALERVLIGRVEGLFANKGGLGQGRQILSRRALPGLLDTMKTALGPDQFDRRAATCNRVLAEMRDEDDAVDWQAIHKNGECNAAVDEVLAIFATYFAAEDAKEGWLVSQINKNLAPAADYAYEGGNVETWRLDAKSVRLLLRGLYARFLIQMQKPDGREELVKRFGEKPFSAVEIILAMLRN